MRGTPCSEASVGRAARILQEGGVVVFPTDTVYGIGCDPYNAEAVRRVYRIKRRDPSKPMPVLVASLKVASQMAAISDTARSLAERFWPGPLTIILRMREGGPAAASRNGSIALRVPGGACISMLLQRCGCIVGSSANMSGSGSSATLRDIEVQCDMALDGGAIPSAGESTIVDATGSAVRVVRQGAIPGEAVY